MSKQQHTPGPWKVTDMDQHPGIETHDESVSIVIFGCRKGLDANPYDDSGVRGKTRKQAIANAHLIAASPDLLEALEAYVEALLDGPENLTSRRNDELEEKARAAIAKAKGGAK